MPVSTAYVLFSSWVLSSRLKLVPHLALDPRREDIFMFADKLLHGVRIVRNKSPQCPGYGFHHHVIFVRHQQATHRKRAERIALTAKGWGVEHHRANQRRSPQPAIR